MRFSLTIESGNAVMVDDTETAVSDMLKEAANSVQEGLTAGNLYDYNGHKVGSWFLTTKK